MRPSASSHESRPERYEAPATGSIAPPDEPHHRPADSSATENVRMPQGPRIPTARRSNSMPAAFLRARVHSGNWRRATSRRGRCLSASRAWHPYETRSARLARFSRFGLRRHAQVVRPSAPSLFRAKIILGKACREIAAPCVRVRIAVAGPRTRRRSYAEVQESSIESAVGLAEPRPPRNPLMSRRERRAAGQKSRANPAGAGTDTPAALSQAGLRHRQAGKPLDAQLCAQQALAIDPDHADTMHLLGQLSFDAGQYDHALEWLTRAIRQDPRPEYLASLGNTLQRQGRHEDALKAFDKAVQLRARRRRSAGKTSAAGSPNCSASTRRC